VEDPEDIDIIVWFNQVGYSIVTVEENPNFPQAGGLIPVPDLRIVFE
jgi:hypothetical protein